MALGKKNKEKEEIVEDGEEVSVGSSVVERCFMHRRNSEMTIPLEKPHEEEIDGQMVNKTLCITFRRYTTIVRDSNIAEYLVNRSKTKGDVVEIPIDMRNIALEKILSGQAKPAAVADLLAIK
jgi:hypothetical protein